MWVCVEMRFLEGLLAQSLVEEVNDQMMRCMYNVLRVLQYEDLPLTEDLPAGGWEGGNGGGGW